MSKKYLRAGLAVLCSLISYGVPAAELYTVSMRLSQEGKVFATPRLTVAAGTESSIERSGEGAFVMSLVASDAGDGRIKLDTRITSVFGAMQPVVITRDGQQAGVSNGQMEIEFVAARVGR